MSPNAIAAFRDEYVARLHAIETLEADELEQLRQPTPALTGGPT